MANEIANCISLHGDPEEIRSMLETIQSDQLGVGSVDFNKIVPMPQSLDIEDSYKMNQGLKAYQDFIDGYTIGRSAEETLKLLEDIPIKSEEIFLRKRTDIGRDEWELGRIAWNNIRQYGAATWYDWCNKNWGTKWNACGSGGDKIKYYDGYMLCFQTAWSAPHPVIEKLAEMYPEVFFEHEWADEDLGNNCGKYGYQNGGRIEEYFPESQKEATEFACRIWGYDLSDMDLYLNTSGTKYINVEYGKYKPFKLFGKSALFTINRLTDADIPQGMYCYYLRYSDDGDCFCSVEPKVSENHAGSVITKEPLDFGTEGYLSFTEDTQPKFTGETQSLGEFIRSGEP